MNRATKTRLLLTLALVAAGLTLSLGLSSARAQLPQEFENLQVLDAEISSRDLMDTMRGFALGLGVRCTHCHVGQDGQPLSTFDFATDEKPAKNAARAMLQMVGDINSDHLSQLPTQADTSPQVSCATCHRGAPQPRTIEQELDAAYATGKLPSALERYRELRAEWYGAATYDFREQPLIVYASSFMMRGDMDSTAKVLEFAAELFPESADSRVMLARSHLSMGNEEEARKYAMQAQALDPDNPKVQALVQQFE